MPERITETERWQVAAGAVEAYRSRWDIAGEANMNTEPISPDQRAHWDKMAATLESAGFTPPGRTTELEPDTSWLASLWERVQNLGTERDYIPSDRVVAADPPQWAWSRDDDTYLDRDDGFGL